MRTVVDGDKCGRLEIRKTKTKKRIPRRMQGARRKQVGAWEGEISKAAGVALVILCCYFLARATFWLPSRRLGKHAHGKAEHGEESGRFHFWERAEFAS